MNSHSSISDFDAFDRNEVLSLLVQCIAELSPTQKTVLALYYHENLQLAEIATCVGLTECEIDQIRAETLALLRTMLAAQIGLAELPVGFDNVAEHGSGVLVSQVEPEDQEFDSYGRFVVGTPPSASGQDAIPA
jgi:hypothetical protein